RPPGPTRRYEPTLQGSDNRCHHLVLHSENVCRIPVVPLRPKVTARACIDQLSGDSKCPADFAHTTLDNMTDAQMSADIDCGTGAGSPVECGVAGKHRYRLETGEVGDDIFGDAVRQILLLRIAAHICERQNRNRGCVCRASGISGHHGRLIGDSINPYPIDHVLECLQAQIFEAALYFVFDMIERRAGDQHISRFRHTSEPGGDIDAVTVEIAALDHDITEIDADSEYNVPILGHTGVCLRHAALQLDRTLNRIDRAAELYQRSITRDFEEAAVMPSHQRFKHLLSSRLERRQGPALVLFHQPAVADHVSS